MRQARTVPPNIAIPELREAYLTFCRRTELLKVVQDIALQIGVRRYQLCPPEGYIVIRATAIVEGTNRLVLRNSPVQSCGAYGDFFMDGPDWIELFRDPIAEDESYLNDPDAPQRLLTIEFVVAPTRDSVAIDKLVWDAYRDTITSGALSRLLLMQDTKWYNPQLASKWENEFKKGLNEGRISTAKNFTNANLRLPGVRRNWI